MFIIMFNFHNKYDEDTSDDSDSKKIKKKKSVCNARDSDLIPGLGRCPGEGNGSPLQPSCWKNPTDRLVWWAIVHRSQRVGHHWTTNTFTYFFNAIFIILQLRKLMFRRFKSSVQAAQQEVPVQYLRSRIRALNSGTGPPLGQAL